MTIKFAGNTGTSKNTATVVAHKNLGAYSTLGIEATGQENIEELHYL